MEYLQTNNIVLHMHDIDVISYGRIVQMALVNNYIARSYRIVIVVTNFVNVGTIKV